MKTLDKIKKDYQEKKAIEKKIEEEEKELKKAVDEEIAEEKISLKETINLLKSSDEEEAEYQSYLTEEEKLEEKRAQKQNKKMTIIGLSIMMIAIILGIFGTKLYYDTFKSDLLKVTEPMLKEHYLKKTGNKAKTKTIEEFIEKDENNKEHKTGICLLTTTDGKHLMAINNEKIGDDINNTSKYEAAKEHIHTFLANVEIVTDNIKLSYDEYYTKYNRFLDYINVLPSEASFADLLATNKLTVTYQAIYQGYLDASTLQNVLKDFSPNSIFIFYHQTYPSISNVTIIKSDSITSLDITAEIEKNANATYLELDRNLNNVTNVEVGEYSSSSVSIVGDYQITNPISFKKEIERRNSEEKDYTSYYLLRLNSSMVSENGFAELSSYKKEAYEELEKEDYEDAFLMTVGNSTYFLSENDLFIGKRGAKKSFLCNLGIC